VHYLPMGEASQTTNSLHETAAAFGGAAKLGLTDINSIALRVGMSGAIKKSTARAKVHAVTIKGSVYLPFTEIARMLRELTSMISAKQLIVLIDEWSSVDIDAQPYLAQLIKRTSKSFGTADPRLHFKIACIPTRTQLAISKPGSPIPIGMEEGDDIFVGANLDRGVYFERDNDQALMFLQDVIRRHACQSLAWVAALEPLVFARFLVSEVFTSREVFSELCWASAGVPRDFLELLSMATRLKLERLAKTIDFRDVRDAVQPAFKAKVKDVSRLAMAVNKSVYLEVVFPNKSYAEFLLSSELADQPQVSTLWVERIWHMSPERYVDPVTGAAYERFRIDYGSTSILLRRRRCPASHGHLRSLRHC
jgi:hypothetical protein